MNSLQAVGDRYKGTSFVVLEPWIVGFECFIGLDRLSIVSRQFYRIHMKDPTLLLIHFVW